MYSNDIEEFFILSSPYKKNGSYKSDIIVKTVDFTDDNKYRAIKIILRSPEIYLLLSNLICDLRKNNYIKTKTMLEFFIKGGEIIDFIKD